jgi:hypothetical protein
MLVLSYGRLSVKYMLMSRYQKAGKKHSTEILNRSFEDMEKFKHFRLSEIPSSHGGEYDVHAQRD